MNRRIEIVKVCATLEKLPHVALKKDLIEKLILEETIAAVTPNNKLSTKLAVYDCYKGINAGHSLYLSVQSVTEKYSKREKLCFSVNEVSYKSSLNHGVFYSLIKAALTFSNLVVLNEVGPFINDNDVIINFNAPVESFHTF